jgi:predicted restriction endonuclease
MAAGDYVLFYRDGEFIGGSIVVRAFENTEVGRLLWDNPESRYLFTLDEYRESIQDTATIFETLGYSQHRIQGFTKVASERVGRLRDEFGTLSAALFDDPPADNTATETEQIDPRNAAAGVQQPKEVHTQITRKIRDTDTANELKELYGYACQLCGETRQREQNLPYAEAHHIHPLGDTPPGPDTKSNILILCPNHHSDFDYGQIKIVDLETFEIAHAYEQAVDGNTLTVNHDLNLDFLQYHNEHIAQYDLETS